MTLKTTFSLSYTPAPKPPARTASDPKPAVRAAVAAVRAALTAKDMDRAAALAQAALDQGVEHPLLLNLAAMPLERAGRLHEAANLLLRAEVLAPEEPAVLVALGLILMELGRSGEALQRFDRAAVRAPEQAATHYNRGAALAALNRPEDAGVAFGRALELQPNHALALAGLAALRLRGGDRVAAADLAGRSLAEAPGLLAPELTLAETELGNGEAAAARARLERAIDYPGRTPAEQAVARGLLGDVLDVLDRPSEAFAAWQACNAALHEIAARTYGDVASALDAARWTARRLDHDDPSVWVTAGERDVVTSPAAGHVFLTGFPGSGASELLARLRGHPSIAMVEEQDTLVDGLKPFLSDVRGLDRLAASDESELGPLREAYWRRVIDARVDVSGKTLIDKHAFSLLKLPLILRLFPDARIVVVRRDPRDVVLESFRQRFRTSPLAFQLLTLEGAAGLYETSMRLTAWLERHAPDRLHALATDGPAGGEAAALLRFIGIDGVADLPPPMTSRWRRYAWELSPALPVLRPWADRYGYAS